MSVSSYEIIKDFVESGKSLEEAKNEQLVSLGFSRYGDMLEITKVLVGVLHSKMEKDGLNEKEKEEVRKVIDKIN